MISQTHRLLLTTVLFLSFFNKTSYAQDENPGIEIAKMEFKAKKVIPPSPDAAELGKYGNVPVSLFTGTPNVSVPFFTLQGNSLSMPISLSYRATGFKPEEVAPWTGLGWSLNAGGVITRSVLGNPDITGNYFGADPFTIPNSNDPIAVARYYQDIRDGVKETQPDIYYYNFNGHSGKFFLTPSGLVLNKERSMLTIVNHSTDATSQFIIIDDQGITYTFSELENTHTVPADEEGITSNTQYNYPSSWYLSSITSADGVEVMELEYWAPTEAQNENQNGLKSESATYSRRICDECPNLTNQQNQAEGQSSFVQQSTTTITRKFLNRITLKRNGQIICYADFESGVNERQDLWASTFNGERLLKKVKLYSYFNATATLIKEFDLGYGYFTGVNNSSGEKRLRLETVKEISVDASATDKPPYQFFYNDGNMPKRFTPGIDHWGFYNGATNAYLTTESILPSVTVNEAIYPSGTYGHDANREPDLAACSLTLLNKITYPTGGYTSFEYELNTAKSEGDNIFRNVGGVRIRTIVDYASASQQGSAKTYEYTEADGSTSGRIGPWPRYDNRNSFQNIVTAPCFHDQCQTPACHNYTTYNVTLSANSIFALGSVNGSHIGYGTVTEYQTNLTTSQPLGKTVYSYQINRFLDYEDDINNGNLLSEKKYDNGGKLVYELTNVYSSTSPESINIRKLVPDASQDSRKVLCYSPQAGYIYYNPQQETENCTQSITVLTRYHNDDYSVAVQDKKLVSTTERIYDQLSNSYATNIKTFTYGNSNHIYPTKIEQTTTGGELVVTEKKYAADYVVTNPVDNESTAIALLQSKNIVGAEMESVQYRQNADGTNKRYISGVLTTYLSSNPYPEKLYHLEMASPLTSFQWSAVNSGSFSKDAHYALSGSFVYNASGNLIEQSKANDVVTSYVWGYNYSYPVAQITGASSSAALGSNVNIAIVQEPANDASLRSELDKIRANVPAALVTIFTYKPLIGMTSQSDQRSRLSYFDYDGLGRLVNVKDHEGNIVKNFKYNYGVGSTIASSATSLYYSAQKQGYFTKACPSGMKILPVFYSVPYGQFVSSVSQPDADAKADSYFNTNGQALANAQTCLYYNVAKSQTFTRACPTGYFGTQVTYTVPADKYSSSVSPTDADNQAQAEIIANGQNYANANGACLPPVTISYANSLNTLLTAQYTNNSTGTVYSKKIFANTSGSFTVPQGTYTITFVIGAGNYFFSLGCMTATGSNISFYNVAVSPSGCNSLLISSTN